MDNFDLKKFLKESKAIENLNPAFKAINEGEAAYEYEKGKEKGEAIEKKKMTKEAMKKQIKDMIVAELDAAGNLSIDTAPGVDAYQSFYEGEDELEEAKKKKDEEVEDVEDVEVTDTTEEVPADEAPADEAPTDIAGGLEDVAADMEGTEGELMDSLMKAFKIAKGMNNEKLETQVGNTLKFFVSEYIGGGEG